MNSSQAMQDDPTTSSADGVSEQTRALARRLSGHMGLDAAIQISTENQWHGVVSVLLEMRKNSKRARP